MADPTVTLRISATGTGAIKAIEDVKRSVQTLGPAGKSAGADASAGIDTLTTALRSNEQAAASLDKQFAQTATGVGNFGDSAAAQIRLLGELDTRLAGSVSSAGQLADTEALLDQAFSAGLITVDEHTDALKALDKQEAALQKTLPKTTGEVKANATAVDKLSLSSVRAQQSIVSMARALVTGNFRQAASSALSLATSSGATRVAMAALSITAGAVAVAIGGVAVAALAGSRESFALQRAVIATGNAAGVTAGQIEDMVGQLDDANGRIGSNRQALLELAGSSRFVGESLRDAGAAAVALSELTGRSVTDTARQIANLATEPSKAIAALNTQYNFLTVSVFSQIRALEEQGRTQDAVRLATATFADVTTQRLGQVDQSLGFIDRSLKAGKDGWNRFWDAAKDIGRAPDARSELDELDAIIARTQRRLDEFKALPAGGFRAGLASATQGLQEQRLNDALARRSALLSDINEKESAAAKLARDGAITEAAIAATQAVSARVKGLDETARRQAELNKLEKEFGALLAANVDEVDGFATAELFQSLRADIIKRFSTEATAALEEVRKKTEEMKATSDAFAAENAKLAADLAGPQAQAFAEYAAGIAQANEVLASGAIGVEAFAERQKLLLEQLNRTTAGIQSQVAPIDELIAQIAEEGQLIGLNNTEREVSIALRQAEQALQQSGVSLASEEAKQQLAVVEGMIRSNQAQQQTVDIAQQAAEDYQRAWQGATDSVLRSFGDFVVRGANNFKSLGRQLKSIAQSFLADLVAMFLRNKLTLQVTGAAGGLGGAGSSFAGALGGLFGGGGTGGNPFNGSGPLQSFQNPAAGGGFSLGSIFGQNTSGSLLGGLGAAAQSAAIGSLIGGLFGGAGGTGGAIGGAVGSIFGPLGAGIGSAIGGAIGSLFGKFKTTGSGANFTIGSSGATGSLFEDQKKGGIFGKKRRTITSALDPETQKALDDLFAGISSAVQAASSALAVDVPQLISGTFRREFDKKGNLTKEFSTIAGKVVNESQEAFAQRLQALNIIAVVDKALGNGEASAIAQQFSGDAEKLLGGAQFLLAAAVDVKNGFGLLGDGTLTDIASLVTDVAKAGEPLIETYARLVTSSNLLEQALQLQGQSLDLSREQFVRFSADIVDAAGGLDRATSLWQDYFKRFFSDNERAASSLSAAQLAAQTQFGDIGLNASDFASAEGLQQFRALFETALPTLSADAVVQWLEAAQAIGFVIDAQDALNQTLAGGTESAEALAQAAADLAQLMAGVSQSLFELDASPLEIELTRINSAMADTLAQATALGASEEQLAQIRGLAARQSTNAVEAEVDRLRAVFADLARAIGDARGSISADILNIRRAQPGFSESAFQAGQISNLRGQLAGATDPQAQIGLIDQIRQATVARYNAEISDIQQTAAAQDQAAQAAQQAIDAQRQALARLRDFADGLGLSSNSPLTAFQRLDVAKGQFDTLLGRARGGDADAIGGLQQAAEALLAENRNVFGVSNTAVAEFDRVQAALRSVSGQAVSGASFSGFERASIDVNSRIAQLQANAIAELQGLDDTLATLSVMQEAESEGTIQALRDRFEQAENHNEKLIEHIQPIFDAFSQANATGEQQVAQLQQQSAQLAAISTDLQNSTDINAAFLDKFLVYAQQQETTMAAMIERLGRAIERSSDAKVRA